MRVAIMVVNAHMLLPVKGMYGVIVSMHEAKHTSPPVWETQNRPHVLQLCFVFLWESVLLRIFHGAFTPPPEVSARCWCK